MPLVVVLPGPESANIDQPSLRSSHQPAEKDRSLACVPQESLFHAKGVKQDSLRDKGHTVTFIGLGGIQTTANKKFIQRTASNLSEKF